MNSTAIRHRFTDFFVDRNHRLVPSSPLIPNDPTLLLADAGMNQFKPYFLGEVEPDFRRATMSATVHLDDDEAYGLWREIGVPAERIQRLGMEENYRSMGVAGSTGPCSEIHYDRGPAFAPGGGPASESDRYLEICNLVFMQNIRDEEFTINGELPEKNIDTGMGRGRDPSRLDEALRIVRADAAGLLEGGDKDPMG